MQGGDQQQYGHSWLNGAKEYVMSDDPKINPNAQLSGSWNQLQPVPPLLEHRPCSNRRAATGHGINEPGGNCER
jgi:hypothetical protein